MYLLKIGTILLIAIYLACVVLAGYVFHLYLGIPLVQISLLLAAFVFFSGLFIKILWNASKKSSPDDLSKENELIDDVASIRGGRNLNPKTNLGKWYLSAFVFAILFPLLLSVIEGHSANFLTQNSILIFGYVVILLFVLGMIVSNKNR